jgi:hypothetical protein
LVEFVKPVTNALGSEPKEIDGSVAGGPGKQKTAASQSRSSAPHIEYRIQK